MHPDTYKLAAYLDGALDEAERAATRAHILTCAACSARLERLREDVGRVATFAAGPAPDVRAAVRARLQRKGAAAWVARGGALAAALAALLLFALLIGISGGTVGRVSDRLLVVDRQTGQLIELDASNGERLRLVVVGNQPSKVRYDRQLDRAYVVLAQAIVAVDVRTLTVVDRWSAPSPFRPNGGIALDERRGWLYVARPEGVIALDAATLVQIAGFHVDGVPGPLVLSPDRNTLFTIDQQDGTVRRIDLPSGAATAYPRDPADPRQPDWLALSSDGQTLYLLRSSSRPSLRRMDVRTGQMSEPVVLDEGPLPWDLLRLDNRRLAIPRGNGNVGGITIVETGSFSVTATIDPNHDQHHLAAAPDGSMFALNFSHNTVTRYDPSHTQGNEIVWQLAPPGWGQPYDGVFVPGGWHWPWQP